MIFGDRGRGFRFGDWNLPAASLGDTSTFVHEELALPRVLALLSLSQAAEGSCWLENFVCLSTSIPCWSKGAGFGNAPRFRTSMLPVILVSLHLLADQVLGCQCGS